MAKLTFPLNIFGGGGTITPGTTPVASGTDKGIFFQDGQTISNSTNFRYDKVTRRILGDTTNPYVELIDATGATLGYGTNSFFRAAGVPSVAVSGTGVTAWQAAGLGIGTLVMGAGGTLTGAFDVGLSRVSPGVWGVGTGAAGSVAGTVSAAAYISGGSAGVDFGPSVVTSITVKKGIITAIS